MTLALACSVTGASGSSPLRKRYSHGLGGILHPSHPVSALLDKRLVVVTGKGGAGKTTIAVALGLAAARHGKRVVLCEVAGGDRMSTLVPGELTTVSVDPDEAKR